MFTMPGAVRRIDHGLPLQKLSEHLQMASLGRRVQRPEALGVHDLLGRPGVQQQPHELHVTHLARQMQRREPVDAAVRLGASSGCGL